MNYSLISRGFFSQITFLVVFNSVQSIVSLSTVSAGKLLISGTSASSDLLIISLNIYRDVIWSARVLRGCGGGGGGGGTELMNEFSCVRKVIHKNEDLPPSQVSALHYLTILHWSLRYLKKVINKSEVKWGITGGWQQHWPLLPYLLTLEFPFLPDLVSFSFTRVSLGGFCRSHLLGYWCRCLVDDGTWREVQHHTGIVSSCRPDYHHLSVLNIKF